MTFTGHFAPNPYFRFMPAKRLPKYVFRGTTKDFPGGNNSREMPYTCASTHPVKALWFALECFYQNPGQAVVYLAQTEALGHIPYGFNHLRKLENEIGFFIQPNLFYPLCDGFIYVADFQKALAHSAIDSFTIVRKENLSQLCRATPAMSAPSIESLVTSLLPYLKK